ncbi:hypothetical protein GCM10027579_13040 [Calidifontibacter terrae]
MSTTLRFTCCTRGTIATQPMTATATTIIEMTMLRAFPRMPRRGAGVGFSTVTPAIVAYDRGVAQLGVAPPAAARGPIGSV